MIYIVNGPNLNLLGKREPDIYGSKTLEYIELELSNLAEKYNEKLDFFQSNHEGKILDYLQSIPYKSKVIINPGGLTHTSVSLRDCILAMELDVIEVHISNIASREEFRHTSLISDVCRGTISGLGTEGYKLALSYYIENNEL